MLNGTLRLHDIRDVEAFTARLIPPLDPQQREDLHAYLIAETWELSLRYTPGGITFSTWARTTLTRRICDWKRQTKGRTRWQFKGGTHERQLPRITPLDDPDHTQRTTTWDPSTDRSPDLARLLRTPGSTEAWRTHQRDHRVPRRAA